MEKILSSYETMFIVDCSESEEATAAVVNYTAGPEFSEELSRVFNITEGVMRYLTIKL